MLDKHLIAKTAPAAREENQITLDTVRITVLTERLFRIEVSPEGRFCDQATQAAWFRDLGAVDFRAEEAGEVLRIETKRAALLWRGSLEESGAVPESMGEAPLGNEGNLLGTCRTLDECDGDRWVPWEGSRRPPQPVELSPGVVSATGAAVLDDSASLVLRPDGMLERRAAAELDVYVFAYGRDYRGAVEALFALCGGTPPIPRFALGNWWSRYHPYTEKEYLHLMDRFAQRQVPLTVATVDMDWHWSETLDEKKQLTARGKDDALHGGKSGWTGYSWNTDLFPDYRRFLRELHERGLHVTLNLHPALGVRFFEDAYPEMCAAMGVDPETEAQIPFDFTDPRFINAYFRILHRPYERDGVDFWWIDWQQGSSSKLEGLDPLWALNHYHFLDQGETGRPLILSRYCGAGAHRYPLGFSGDTIVTWDTLRYLPYFTATASNAGYAWWSHDIGGHMGGSKDDELYVRFLQFGVFSPINRLHSTNSPTFTKEPWAFMGGTGLVAEEFLRLRHRMIPFLYSASRETAERGRALVEPLYYGWPMAEAAYRYPNEYLFGGQLLVAPVTERSGAQGLARVRVWLPAGRWTDFFTGDEYEGGRELTLSRWLEEMPVLLKEGGFFVLDGRGFTNDTEVPDRLVIYITNGCGAYTLHEDQDGERYATTFASQEGEGVQFVTICPQGRGVRHLDLRFCNIPTGEVEVLVDGASCPAAVSDNGRLRVELDVLPRTLCEIAVYFQDQAEEKRLESLRRTITRLQMDSGEKNALYEDLRVRSGAAYREAVQNAELPEAVQARLLECAPASEG